MTDKIFMIKENKPKSKRTVNVKNPMEKFIADPELFKDALLLLFEEDKHFCKQVKKILSES